MKKADVIIIGAGPAGLTAGLYASRAGAKTIILDRGVAGGQINNTDKIENVPGFGAINGQDLSKKLKDSAVRFGAKLEYGDVQAIVNPSEMDKTVRTDMGDYHAPAVIIAGGSKPRRLNIPGEQKYQGRGISYCAVCDGNFFKGDAVAVIGGGNSAASAALYLAGIAKKVYLVHRRSQLRADQVLQSQINKKGNIEIVWNSIPKAFKGSGGKLTNIKLYNKKTRQTAALPVDGAFIFIGSVPQSKIYRNLNIVDIKGANTMPGGIVTDKDLMTLRPGIYAAGDILGKSLRQIVTAEADGALAGQKAAEFAAKCKN